MLTPKKSQAEAISRVVSEPTKAALIAADTGFGKTLAAIEIARQLDAKTVLIIAPLKTLDEEGWVGTIEGQETGLPVRRIDSKKGNLENFDRLCAGEPGFYLVGREFFAISGSETAPKAKMAGKKYLRDANGEIVMTKGRKARWSWAKANKHLDLAVYDEVQAVSNRWSAGFAVLKQVKPKFKVAMSATPGRNNFDGLWAPCRWLWPTATNAEGKLIVDNSKRRWETEYCVTAANVHARRNGVPGATKVTGEREPGKFVASLPCYLRYEAPKVPVVKRKVRIPMSPSQQEMYDKMEKDAFIWLDEHPLVADLPMIQKLRMRQIALGEVTLREDGVVDFADDCVSAKADACELIRTKHHPGEPIVFYTSSQKFARVLANRLPGAVEWSGKVTGKKRDQIKADFIAGKVPYIVAVIPSIAEGVNGLQRVCNVEVWLDKSFDGMFNQQAEGRLNRTGQEKDIISYELIVNKADDDTINKLAERAAAMRASLGTGGRA